MREIINNIPIGNKNIINLATYNGGNRPNWTTENQEELFYAYFEPLFFATEHLEVIHYVKTYEDLWLQTHRETSSNTSWSI